jgi:hypothetical protein
MLHLPVTVPWLFTNQGQDSLHMTANANQRYRSAYIHFLFGDHSSAYYSMRNNKVETLNAVRN